MGKTYADSSCAVWGIPEINYAVAAMIREVRSCKVFSTEFSTRTPNYISIIPMTMPMSSIQMCAVGESEATANL